LINSSLFTVSNPIVVNVDGTLDFQFTFGLKLQSGSAVDNSSFLHVEKFSANATAKLAKPGVDGQAGILGVQLPNAALNLNATLTATPSGGGDLSLSQLQAGDFASVLNLQPTADSFQVDLPMSATLGDWTASGTPDVTIQSQNIFSSAPTVTFNNDFNQLLIFARLNPSNLVSILNGLATGLQKAGGSLNLPGGDLPFLGQQISQLVSVNQMIGNLHRTRCSHFLSRTGLATQRLTAA
jgi:hypothetical protein